MMDLNLTGFLWALAIICLTVGVMVVVTVAVIGVLTIISVVRDRPR